MKYLLAITSALLMNSAAHAVEIKSNRETSQVNIARVVSLVNLVDKPNIRVSLVVKDHGGSTDLSPTQEVFLTLYVKGEMFSTDAAFSLGDIFGFKSAKRISGGIYSVDVISLDDSGMPTPKTIRVDATKAITAIQAVRCDDLDCDASAQFNSTIELTSFR